MELLNLNDHSFLIPSYLLEESKEALKQALKNFPSPTKPEKFYAESNNTSLFYQGDGIFEIPFFSLDENGNATVKYYDGMVLSNTCGIDPSNVKSYETYINIAKILNLNEFTNYLVEQGVSKDKVESLKTDLKENRINNFIYIPGFIRNEFEYPDSIVQIDQISSIPLKKIYEGYDLEYKNKGDRIFSFSNYGFYVLIVKLSVFFSRFSEKIDRFKSYESNNPK